MGRSDGFTIQQTGRADEIGQPAWDALSAGRPFTSHRWTRFGEAVMSDCTPTHILLHFDNQPAARATFWRVAAEPLPLPPLMRTPVSALLRRHPLLICRVPLANWTGLLLPDDPSLRSAARTAIHAEGLHLLKEMRGSYLLYDFLDAPDLSWPVDVAVTTVSDPGTRMEIHWSSFEEYIASLKGHERRKYTRVLRETSERGLMQTFQTSATDLAESLALIRRVERKFSSAPNPWIEPLLHHAREINGIFHEIHQDGRLVCCGLLLEDNGVMVATAFGMAEDVQYAYFLLMYGFVEQAIARGASLLRLGSGAYEVKHHLGCVLEINNHTAVAAHRPMLRWLAKWLG